MINTYSDKKKVNQEVHTLCQYRSICCARFLIIITLFLLYYPMRPTPAYLVVVFIACPLIIQFLLRSSHPQRSERYIQSVILKELYHKYHFNYDAWRSERICSLIILFFLATWQYVTVSTGITNQITHTASGLVQMPTFCILLYLLLRLILYPLFRLQLHYRFTHML